MVERARQGMGFIAGFLPWIIFWVVASPSSWEWAALGALIAAVVLALPAAEQHRLKILDVGTIAFFAVLAALALFLDQSDLDWVEKNSQGLSSLALAAIAGVSLLTVPFTEQYAREDVPREHWDSPVFKRINFNLTAVWTAAFVVMAIAGFIGANADSASTRDFFQWIVSIAVLVAAIKFTQWYPDQVTGPDEPQAQPAAAQPGSRSG